MRCRVPMMTNFSQSRIFLIKYRFLVEVAEM